VKIAKLITNDEFMKLKFFSFNEKCAKISNNKLIDTDLSLTYYFNKRRTESS
jgi:hypothetical protein